jgi:hypothetical protein
MHGRAMSVSGYQDGDDLGHGQVSPMHDIFSLFILIYPLRQGEGLTALAKWLYPVFILCPNRSFFTFRLFCVLYLKVGTDE